MIFSKHRCISFSRYNWALKHNLYQFKSGRYSHQNFVLQNFAVNPVITDQTRLGIMEISFLPSSIMEPFWNYRLIVAAIIWLDYISLLFHPSVVSWVWSTESRWDLNLGSYPNTITASCRSPKETSSITLAWQPGKARHLAYCEGGFSSLPSMAPLAHWIVFGCDVSFGAGREGPPIQ